MSQPDAPAGAAVAAARATVEAYMSVPSGETVARRLLDCEVAALDFLIRAARAEGAAEEREACAKLCDEEEDRSAERRDNPAHEESYSYFNGRANGAGVMALRIRARSPSSGTEAQP